MASSLPTVASAPVIGPSVVPRPHTVSHPAMEDTAISYQITRQFHQPDAHKVHKQLALAVRIVCIIELTKRAIMSHEKEASQSGSCIVNERVYRKKLH